MKINKTYSAYNHVMSIKAQRRDWSRIVLMKRGNFYETYEEDAKELSTICNLTIVYRRGCLLKIAVFSREYLDVCLPKLIRAGKTVCIVDNFFD